MGKFTSSCGFVYFIQAGDAGLIKIGWALEPEQRRKELQTGSADRLRLIGAFEGDRLVEQGIHRRLKHLRSHGEWFRPTLEIEQVMQEHGAAARMDREEKRREPFTDRVPQSRACLVCGNKYAYRTYSLVEDNLCQACDEIRVLREAGIDPLKCSPADEERIPLILRRYRAEAEDAYFAA